MSYIDILFFCVILFAAFIGWHKGFMVSMLELFSWLTTLVLTYILYPYVADVFEKLVPGAGVWVSAISILVLLLVLSTFFSYLVNALLHSVPDNYHHHLINKISGIIPGLICGCLYSVIIIALLFSLPVSAFASPSKGILLDKLSPKIQWLGKKASKLFGKDVIWPENMLTVDPESEKSIQLGFTVTRVKVRPDLESKMLHLVNIERKKLGIDTLEVDTALTSLARKYSTEMFARGYFSHYTPEGKNPFDRMREARIRFRSAGENLALAPTLNMAHVGLMNSPGHRANILRKSFGRVGIGVVEGGRHGLMISQEFRN